MNENFLTMLKGLNSKNKMEAINAIFNKFHEREATNPKFYSDPEAIKKCQNELFDIINTSDKFLETLIRVESATPYTIFSYILQENWSDIIIHGKGVKLSDHHNNESWECPEEFTDLYKMFQDHLVENIKYLASKKFDTANAILDAEVGELRFNLTHRTLTNSFRDIIVIRKQLIGNGNLVMDESYLKSITHSQKHVDVINKYSEHGNFIIFGETGSGKTTLLKYMVNRNLDQKRNLCTIEDTRELNVDVPISLITNHHFKIKDLFTAALRQDPSTIIIGETRTDEIVDILEATLTINVGTTIHANSFDRAIQRIVFMSLKRDIAPATIMDLVQASIDCFIFMEHRKVKEVWCRKHGHFNSVYDAFEEVE